MSYFCFYIFFLDLKKKSSFIKLTFISSFISRDWIVFFKESPNLYELQIWQNLDLSVNLRLCLVMLKFNHINALVFFIIFKYKYYFLFFFIDRESSTERKTTCSCCLKNELLLVSFLVSKIIRKVFALRTFITLVTQMSQGKGYFVFFRQMYMVPNELFRSH